MTAPERSGAPLTAAEVREARQALSALRAQVQAGQIDLVALARQIDRLDALLARAEQGRQQEGRFEALYNVSRLIGSSLDLQTVLDQVIDAIIGLTGAERGFLMLRDDDGGLTVKVARNFDQQTISKADASFSRTIVNQVLDSGKPIVTTNAVEDPRFAQKASIVMQALRSVMATPLRARGSVIGVAYVDNKVVTGLFTEGDLAALDTLAGQAAVAIDNALLFSATDQELALRVEELRQLRRVDRLLNETLDARTAMQHTLEWACRLSEASFGHLGLLEGSPPTLQAAFHHGVSDGRTRPLDLAERFPAVAEALAANRTVTARSGETALLIVPITREQRAAGALILGRDDGRAFTPHQQDIVERVVDRAAVAIENARLFESVSNAKRLMDNVFASITSGVITTNEMEQIILFNRAAEQVLRCPASTAVGACFTNVLPEPLVNELRPQVEHVKTYGDSVIGLERELSLPDRGQIILRTSLSPLKDADEEPQGIAIVIDDLTEQRRLEARYQMFQRFLPRAVIERLPPDPRELKLGGQRQEITSLFADIRGFTTFSQRHGPEKLVEVLNQYLAVGAEAVRREEGTLDKILGDCVVAFFNAPLRQPDHVLRAVRAALKIQEGVARLHEQLPEEYWLNYGIGINIGDVVVGFIGTEQQMNYTAIGSTVNLTSRLQNAAGPGQILLSEPAYLRIQDQVEARPLPPVEVKGYSEPIPVYELLGLR